MQLVNRKVSVVSSSSSSGEGGEVVALANGPGPRAAEPQQVVVQSSPDSTSNVNDQVSLRSYIWSTSSFKAVLWIRIHRIH
jgi:hypothetical protein